MHRPRVLRRPRLARSPLAYWAVVGALAVVTGLVAARSVATTGALAARYGPLRPVVVATHRLEVGVEVAAADVEVRQVPASLVPAGAVPSPEAAAGRTVLATAFAGLPVLEDNLAPSGRRGVAALLPPGTRAVAVPNSAAPLPLVPGDEVDVLATFDPSAAAGTVPTLAVAREALVVDVGEDAATVAVAPEEATRVAYALSAGVVTLALASPVSASSMPRGGARAPPAPPGR